MSPFDETYSLNLTRRHFLKVTLAASVVALNLSIPLDLFAAEGADGLPSIPGRKPRAPRLLMIDPGHGGRDPGAIGVSGTHEKDVTLDIARRLTNAIASRSGTDAKLTRDEDIFLPLEDRVKISRDARADLFVSIHADSAPNTDARGLSVYTLSEHATDSFSKQLADHENEADMMGGMDLPPADKDVTAILFDLASRRAHNTAQHARASFVSQLGHNWRLLESPMRAANFVVLRAPDVPSMLVETGFLSNPKDEHILRDPAERDKIAKLMAKSLGSILDSPLFG